MHIKTAADLMQSTETVFKAEAIKNIIPKKGLDPEPLPMPPINTPSVPQICPSVLLVEDDG